MTRLTADVAVGAVAIVLAWCCAQALAGEPALDAQLRAPVYAVGAPVATTVPVSSLEGAVPSASTLPPPSSGSGAVVAFTADRGTAVQVAPTVPPPAPTGLHGLPFAPAGLTACETASFYRAQAGLPAVFDALAYRESRCQPDAANWCCSGLWQIHKLWISRLAGCGVFVRNDLYDGQRNACAAAFVFVAQGITAWSTA